MKRILLIKHTVSGMYHCRRYREHERCQQQHYMPLAIRMLMLTVSTAENPSHVCFSVCAHMH